MLTTYPTLDNIQATKIITTCRSSSWTTRSMRCFYLFELWFSHWSQKNPEISVVVRFSWGPSHLGILLTQPKPLLKNLPTIRDVVLLLQEVFVEYLGSHGSLESETQEKGTLGSTPVKAKWWTTKRLDFAQPYKTTLLPSWLAVEML